MLPIGQAIWCRRVEPGLLQGFSLHDASGPLSEHFSVLETLIYIKEKKKFVLAFFPAVRKGVADVSLVGQWLSTGCCWENLMIKHSRSVLIRGRVI